MLATKEEIESCVCVVGRGRSVEEWKKDALQFARLTHTIFIRSESVCSNNFLQQTLSWLFSTAKANSMQHVTTFVQLDLDVRREKNSNKSAYFE